VRGPAGSGKTTLLQWIAVNAAGQTLPPVLTDWNGLIPFFIRLRRCLQTGFPGPEAFPSLVSASLADVVPEGWVRAQLSRSRALVLIDGIDEVPHSQRGQLREWIKDLVGAFPDARYILTSRPHAVEDGWLLAERFSSVDLQPMGPSDIDVFIEHWHEAVREGSAFHHTGEDFSQMGSDLKRLLRRTPTLSRLAANPLLCAMLCALNRERRGYPPLNRIQLYEACSQLLLERRDKERGIDLQDYPSLDYSQKRTLLDDLASWLLLNGWSETDFEMADRRFAQTLAQMPQVPLSVTPESARRLLIERTAMLREPYPQHVDFPHRTFQEFFAAQHAVSEGNVGLLADHADDDQWREVLILAAGLSDKNSSQRLISELNRRGDAEPKRRQQFHLLAAACVETVPRIDPEIRAQVNERLTRLIPPANLTEARELATAGAVAVPFLATHIHEAARLVAARIRALALIGGPDAMEGIRSFCSDDRQTVIDELLKAWRYFDHDEYFERVVSNITGAPYRLTIQKPLPYYPQPAFSEVTELDIENCVGLKDLDNLTELNHLSSLSLRYCSDLENIDALSRLKELKRFAIKGTYSAVLRDLSPLSQMDNLEQLYLQYCHWLTDLAIITHLPKLRILQLVGVRGHLRSRVFPSAATGTELLLRHLWVDWIPPVPLSWDLTAIGSYRNLESIYFSSLTTKSIAFVRNLPKLRSVSFIYVENDLDLKPLLDVPSLESVRVRRRLSESFFLSFDQYDKMQIADEFIQQKLIEKGVRAKFDD
jgi:hypothetical protein